MPDCRRGPHASQAPPQGCCAAHSHRNSLISYSVTQALGAVLCDTWLFQTKQKLRNSAMISLPHSCKTTTPVHLHHVILGISNTQACNIYVGSSQMINQLYHIRKGQEPVYSDWILLCRGWVAAISHSTSLLTGHPASTSASNSQVSTQQPE